MAKVSSFLDSAGSSTSLSSNMPWIMRNLITRLLIIIIIIIITSTSDLQPSTPTANQLPGQLVSTEIRTTYV